MSALGSSVINKSGKKFAPKAPARRPAAQASTQPSARPSVDRQVQSQTPQPQVLPQSISASTTLSASESTLARLQERDIDAPAKAASDDGAISIQQPSRPRAALGVSPQPRGATSIPAPSRSTQNQSHTSLAPLIAQKRLPDPQPTPGSVDGLPARNPSSGLDGPDTTQSSFTPSPNARANARERQSSLDANEATLSIATSPNIVHEENQGPATKRRRIEKNSTEQQPSPEASANVPLPTIETNAVIVGRPDNANAASTPAEVAKAKKPRLSAQEQRKQQIEKAAAKVVGAAIRKSTARVKRPRKSTKGKEVHVIDEQPLGAAADPSVESNSQNNQIAVSVKPKRTYTKRKTSKSIQDAAAQVVEDAVQGSSKKSKGRGRKSRREATPEGADTAVISPSIVKMADLCKDNRIGRKSDRERDLEEFDRAEFVRKKQKELQEVMGQNEPERQAGPSSDGGARLERLGRQREREESVAMNVPNTIIVNGQIQIDEDSLQIDRHAGAAAEREAENLETVDETDLTRKINSSSFLKREKSGGWNELLTERFYDGLRMFGTDFEMISKMFPGRTRHKIKLKFVKEEKLNQDKIKATLLGEKIPVDLPELEKMAGVEFDDPMELEREMEEDRRILEEETLAAKQALDEIRKEREDQIAAERAAAGEESSAKENRRGKNKKKRGERQKGDKNSSKRKGKRGNKATVAGGADVLAELNPTAGT